MSTQTAYDALRDWFEANWLGTERKFENEGHETPSNLAPFVYMETRGGVFAQKSIGGGPGGNLWREEGTARFYVCVPSGTGVETARGLAAALIELLKGLTLSPGLTCRQLGLGLSGPFEADGNYLSLPVIAWWQRDEAA